MTIRTAEARWEGTLKEGNGHLKLGSGAYEGQYNFTSRFEEGVGTNPEELLGAAHAGCYSMALNNGLVLAGFMPNYVHTSAKVHLTRSDGVTSISKIELTTEAQIPNIDDAKFQEFAQDTLVKCIISRALNAVEMTVEATLK